MVLHEEGGRVHAIGDGASDDGEPREDDRGLIGIREEDLLGDVPEDGKENERDDGGADLDGEAEGLELLDQRPCDVLDETHGRVPAAEGEEGLGGKCC